MPDDLQERVARFLAAHDGLEQYPSVRRELEEHPGVIRIYEKVPEALQVGEALANFNAGKEINVRCPKCGEPIQINHLAAIHRLWVGCKGGHILAHFSMGDPER